MKTSDRRNFLKAAMSAAAGLASTPLLSGLAGCQSAGQTTTRATALPIEKLTERVTVITGAPGNVIALMSAAGVLLVDSGSAPLAGGVRKSLAGAKVHTLFNTHYHADQTGGNVLFGKEGATVHAHKITQQWLSTDYYVPGEDRWVEALPEIGRPTRTFRLKGEISAGVERVEYGYLLEAHTRGDIYVFFRDSNVLAVGDVASPLRDPAHDWFSGGWLGGRVDALDDLLELANDQTRIVPAYGPVMTRTELQAERDTMLKLYDRTTLLTTQGYSAQDMLDAGVLQEVSRTFAAPYRFLYDVAQGHWAHYTNFGGNIV
jgi:cyclase